MLQKRLLDKIIAIWRKDILIVIFIIVALFTAGFLTYPINAKPERDTEVKRAIDEILSSKEFSAKSQKKIGAIESVKSLMESIKEFLDSLESDEKRIEIPRDYGRYNKNDSSWDSFISRFLIVIAVIVLLALIIFIIYRLFKNYSQTKKINYDTDEDMLFVFREPEEVLDISIKKYKEGRYRESLRYLYLSIIIYLNRKDLVRIDKAKTNRQYVGELFNKGYKHLDLFKKFTISFNIHWYGAVTIKRSEMEYWLGEYHRLTQEEDS